MVESIILQVISAPFVMTHEHVQPILTTALPTNGTNGTVPGWLGKLDAGPSIGLYIDTALMLICGGLPWQVSSWLHSFKTD